MKAKLVKEESIFKAPSMSDLKIKGKPASEYTLIQTWDDTLNGDSYVMYTDSDNNTVLITKDGLEILEADLGGGGVAAIDMIKEDVVNLILAMLYQHGSREN